MSTTTHRSTGSGIPRLRVMRVITRMNVGGPAVQVSALMRGLDPDRFDHLLITGQVGSGEADYLDQRAADLPVHRLEWLGRSVRPTDDVRCVVELARAMRRFRPHIVHTHTAKAGALGRAAAVLARVPSRVHTFHGHLLHGYFSPAKTRVLVQTERSLAALTDRLVAVGSRVRDDLVAAGIGKASQYTVTPPGTRLATAPEPAEARRLLGLPQDCPVVAYVGRITGIKRPDRFLAVAREVRRAVPAAHFVVCGEGDFEPDPEAVADLGDSLHRLGWRADVETVYAAADLVLLTSDNEGMPVSLIEAGLAGLPVVATNVGSVAEVVQDGTTGLLAQPSSTELARHTVTLLRDGQLRQEMGARAQTFTTQHFGAERLVADTQALYTSIAVARGWWTTSPFERSAL
ncbi:glycosyltransferase [Streptomyces sp. NBC_01481]|uniref:glycosyltransferase n=1 Tax=Streptomyces sp. NBC_01481 TaxID=2975869 RepID=UPI002258E4EF|nr:glycosyltransferase [Streptomyces sp. NBC_01481]MCX4585376.1 glycosyltransferase [Streptomyces sp. NBC_01481]